MSRNTHSKEDVKKILKAFLAEKDKTTELEAQAKKQEQIYLERPAEQAVVPAPYLLLREMEGDLTEAMASLQAMTQEGRRLFERMNVELRHISSDRREREELEIAHKELQKNNLELTALSEMRQTAILQLQEQLHKEQEKQRLEKRRLEAERLHLVERLAETLSQVQRHLATIKMLEEEIAHNGSK